MVWVVGAVCTLLYGYLLWEVAAALWEFAVKRPVVVAVRLTEAEAAYIDRERGRLTRSAWLRLLLLNRERSGSLQGVVQPRVDEDIKPSDF